MIPALHKSRRYKDKTINGTAVYTNDDAVYINDGAAYINGDAVYSFQSGALEFLHSFAIL